MAPKRDLKFPPITSQQEHRYVNTSINHVLYIRINRQAMTTAHMNYNNC